MLSYAMALPQIFSFQEGWKDQHQSLSAECLWDVIQWISGMMQGIPVGTGMLGGQELGGCS